MTKSDFSKMEKLNEGTAAKAKESMAQNLQKCQSVWQAFEKFIHKQVVEKGRTVDTLVIGMFRQEPTTQQV